MNRKSGTPVSRGKRVDRDVSQARLFSNGVTAVMALVMTVLANVTIVDASRSDNPSKANHTLNQVRLHSSHNLTSEFITLQIQQSGASTKGPPRAPNSETGAG